MHNSVRVRLFILLFLIPGFFAFAAETEPPSWFESVTLNGFVSFAISHNFNDPLSDANQLRVFDFDDDDFKIDVAELVFQKPVVNAGDVGFRVDLEAGASIPQITASRGLFRDESTGQAEDFDLQQAFVSYVAPVGSGLRLDFGKFITHAGAEVIEGYDGYNDNYTRSILFGFAIPFTHTGIKASYPFSSKVSGTVMMVNGWDNVRDNNDNKTLGGQLVITPNSMFTLYTNFLIGPEQDGNNDDSRKLLDLVAVVKPAAKLTLTLNYDYATEDFENVDAKWSGFAAIVRYDFTDSCAIAVRGEWFDDEDGVRTGAAQTLKEFTITPIYKVNSNFVFRGDLRFDSSDENVFDEDGDATDSQTTLAFNALYLF